LANKLYLGVDICEVDRIDSLYKKYGEKFLDKILTENEKKYCLADKKNAKQRIAVRFASKEALSKAIGLGLNKIGWNKGINFKDIELKNDKNGSPTIELKNHALKLQNDLGIKSWTVSVSHSNEYAIANVAAFSEYN
jgi:holo-[acyl-carrier protein] synthase